MSGHHDDSEGYDRRPDADEHPEANCHRCGGPNVTWSAPSPLWNEVMRGGDIDGLWLWDEIICPTCFAVLAEEAGIAHMWRLSAQEVYCTLQTVTPSGRTWNATTWLWDDRRPAAEAGRADDDGGDVLDLDAIRTQIVYASQDFTGFDLPRFTNHARKITAPLFAEIERLRAALATYQRPGTPTYDQLLASHGQLLNDRDEWARGAREDGAEIERLTRALATASDVVADYDHTIADRDIALAEVTRERDEARAKAVDGGEWQWGVRTTWDDETITDGWYRDEAAARRVAAPSPARNQVIRRRVGPVEPVTDDGAAP